MSGVPSENILTQTSGVANKVGRKDVVDHVLECHNETISDGFNQTVVTNCTLLPICDTVGKETTLTVTFVITANSTTSSNIRHRLDNDLSLDELVETVDFNCTECCPTITSVDWSSRPFLLGSVVRPPNSTYGDVTVTGVAQTIDRNPEFGVITLDVYFVRSPYEGVIGVDLVEGYRLYLKDSRKILPPIILRDESTLRLGGFAGGRITNPYRFVNFPLQDYDTFGIVPFNSRGEGDIVTEFAVGDYTPPTTAAEDVTQSLDVNHKFNFISANVRFRRPLNETSGRYGTDGYNLYLAVNGTRLQLLQSRTVEELGGTPGTVTSFGFQLLSIAFDTANEFIVLPFNLAFLATPEFEALGPLTDRGLTEGVAAAATAIAAATASVAAASAAASGAAGSGAAGAGAAGGGSSAGSSTANPLALAAALQGSHGMSQQQIGTMPTTTRGLGASFGFTNMNLGLYNLIDNGPGNNATSNSSVTAKFMKDESLTYAASSDSASKTKQLVENSATYINVIADGRAPQQYFREVALAVGLLAAFVAMIVAAQLIYMRCVSQRTMGMKHKFAKYKGLAFVALSLCYYGGFVSALFALSIDGMSNADVFIAFILVLFLGVPLPILTVLVYLHYLRIRHKADMVREKKRVETTYRLLLFDRIRPGYEWYPVLGMFRRCSMAMTTALMINMDYAQCWTIASIYMINFVACLVFQPQEGMWRSADFWVDIVSQLLNLMTCFVSIYCYLNTGTPDERVGTAIMICQLVGILVTVLLMLPKLIVAIVHTVRAKDDVKEAELEKQDSELPDSFVFAVPRVLSQRVRSMSFLRQGSLTKSLGNAFINDEKNGANGSTKGMSPDEDFVEKGTSPNIIAASPDPTVRRPQSMPTHLEEDTHMTEKKLIAEPASQRRSAGSEDSSTTFGHASMLVPRQTMEDTSSESGAKTTAAVGVGN